MWRGLKASGLTLHREPPPGADLRNPAAIETAAQRLVLRELLRRLRIGCVLDVGAHEGGYGQLLRDIGYAGEIVSLEPVDEPFAVLEGRARLDPRWRVHKLALGERTESLSLNVTRERNFSSFLRPAAHAVERFPGGPQVERREYVPVVPLAEVFDELTAHVPSSRAFLKVDTQGFDDRVLRGAGDRLEGIDGLQLELALRPLYEGQPTLEEGLSRARELGFEPVHLAPVARDERLRLIEVDCLMVRERAGEARA